MPARLRDLARVLREMGVEISDKGGKHTYRAIKPGCRVFTVPAHNGYKTEIDDKYIQALCRNLDLDEATLWALLRGERVLAASK